MSVTGTPGITGDSAYNGLRRGWNGRDRLSVSLRSFFGAIVAGGPALNTAAGTNFASMFTNCYSLQRSRRWTRRRARTSPACSQLLFVADRSRRWTQRWARTSPACSPAGSLQQVPALNTAAVRTPPHVLRLLFVAAGPGVGHVVGQRTSPACSSTAALQWSDVYGTRSDLPRQRTCPQRARQHLTNLGTAAGGGRRSPCQANWGTAGHNPSSIATASRGPFQRDERTDAMTMGETTRRRNGVDR